MEYILEFHPEDILNFVPDAQNNTAVLWIAALLRNRSDPNGSILEKVAKWVPQTFKISNHEGVTPAHLAAECGILDIFEIIAAIAPKTLSAQDSLGLTPAMLAATRGHLNILRFLISREATSTRSKTLTCRNPNSHFSRGASDYLAERPYSRENQKVIQDLRAIEKNEGSCFFM